MSLKNNRNFKIRGLGEVAIRCEDMAAMIAFYRDVIGLELLSVNASGHIVFFKIADGFEGHTTVLALFDKATGNRPGSDADNVGPPMTGARSSLHHIALTVPFSEQQAVMDWYDSIGRTYRVEHFGWIGWRGVFTEDPEGNTVELVAFHASLKDLAAAPPD